MSYKSETIDRICAISVKAAGYVESELNTALSEEAGDTEETTIFMQVLLILIKELNELGIQFTYDLDDLITNSRYTQGLIALREFIDKDNLRRLLSDNETFKQRCNGVLLSIDTEQQECVGIILNICRHTGIGDPAKLEIVLPLEDGMFSNRLFEAHLSAIIDLAVPKSKLTDNTVQLMSSVFSAVSQIFVHWSEVWDILSAAHVHHYDKDAAFKLFAGDWLDPVLAEQHSWILGLPVEHSKISDINTKALNDLHTKREFSTPGNINYYVNKKIEITELDLLLLYTNCVLWEYARTRETFRPIKWMLISPARMDIKVTMLGVVHNYMIANNIMPDVATALHAAITKD